VDLAERQRLAVSVVGFDPHQLLHLFQLSFEMTLACPFECRLTRQITGNSNLEVVWALEHGGPVDLNQAAQLPGVGLFGMAPCHQNLRDRCKG
jgi:hypothetical protein